MSYYDERVENAMAWIESQQQAEAEQQYIQAEYEAALARHPDVGPQDVADNAEKFGWDFDATAVALREHYAATRDAPRTIGEATDRMMQDLRAG